MKKIVNDIKSNQLKEVANFKLMTEEMKKIIWVIMYEKSLGQIF